MTAIVISHHGPRRKRVNALAYAPRRLGALALAIVAVAAAGWLASLMGRPAAKAPPAAIVAGPYSQLQEIDVALDLAGPPRRPVRRRSSRSPSPVPLNASASMVPERFEVLTGAELDAISQARD